MSAYLRSALLVSATCWLLAPHVISGQSRPAEEASHRKTVGTKKHKNSGTFILVGAGDIASCEALEGAEATAKLIDGIPGEVFAAGDLAYENGTTEEFKNCYDKRGGASRIVPTRRPAITSSTVRKTARPTSITGARRLASERRVTTVSIWVVGTLLR